MVFIQSLEKALNTSLGRKVEIKKGFEPIKLRDVLAIYASTERLQEIINFNLNASTSIQDGFQQITDWYVEYYNKK